MKRFLLPLAALMGLAACNSPSSKTDFSFTPVEYPVTTKQDVVDDYFGTEVPDPYRWLELDTAANTEAWVVAQNKVTSGFLANIPFRDRVADRLRSFVNYKRRSAPYRVGAYQFFYQNNGLQNQDVIYRQKGPDGAPKVFIDPNAVNPEGTTSINLLAYSHDERYIGVATNQSGSDWTTITIREVATNTPTGDTIEWVKFGGIAWFQDGFFYSAFEEPAENTELSAANNVQRVYYHKLGDEQADDRLVFEDAGTTNLYYNVSTTEDEEYLILYKQAGTEGRELHVMALSKGIQPSFTPLFTGFQHKPSVVAYWDGKLLVRTNEDAPHYKLIAIDPANPTDRTDILPETEHVLNSVSFAGGKLFANYMVDVTSRVYQYEPDGSGQQEIELPTLGTAGGFGGKKDVKDVYYVFTSFTYPSSIYRYDIATGTSELFFQPELPFDPSQFETKQVRYKSKDGTEVPMFITHKKGLKLDGSHPTWLYGYGGFNISLQPSFSSFRAALMDMGAVFAMPNLRGGGEYGEAWHRAGMLEKKQTVFDDFIAAGEWLIENNYTDTAKLGISGGSNGGLLVGACMTQRPELFAVAVPRVGVLDMLRYHKFTVGWGWVPEYGQADQSKEEFDYLFAYSPLHNLRQGTAYPATLVMTADHDDRVVPAHSFKFAATLQERHAGEAPVLIRIETSAGHGAGKSIEQSIQESADMYSFFFFNTKSEPQLPAQQNVRL